MTRPGKVFAWIAIGLLVVLALAITFTVGWRPFIGPQARPVTRREFERTPARLARGEYLVNAVTDCMGCHAEHDWTALGAPVLPDTLGAGQDMAIIVGLPGHIVAPNITPDTETGAGNWTDDQFGRAIREGIGHDGRALFPFMPYPDFRSLSDDDLASVIGYLRSIPAVRKGRPTTKLIFPVNYLIRSVPEPLDAPVPRPDVSTPVKRGAYLVRIAGCGDCHTPQNSHGQPLPGLEFAGGQVFEGPWGRAASANITPDASGLPYEALFTEAMHGGTVKGRALNPIMPWDAYRRMTDEDLTAVFAYLRTLKPMRHYVNNSEPPTYCKVCRHMHGGGNAN
jgi:mono/diheme cytochrome c family protein